MIKNLHITILIMALLILSFNSISTVSLATPTEVSQGICTEQGHTPEQLVKEHFIKGGCRNVTNIKALGRETSLGFFTNGENIIGFESGVIISTGNIADASGPNISTETTTAFNDHTGDPYLNLVATDVVTDAAGIEFDFIPLHSQVTFQYVFASEEYCEYVGSIFNDIFGFFVSGPGIQGEFFNDAINVALIPGTDEYVAINSVNNSTHAGFYVKNELEEDVDQCAIGFNPRALDLIEYDGFTEPLIATIDVIPCESYRIRLVIGDVKDDKLDSAVFLAAKSFDLGEEVFVRAEVEGSDEPIAYETCRDGHFVFERGSNLNLDQPKIVNFTISPMSDATPNVDYVGIPGSITIPAMASTAILPIEVIADQIQEQPERLRLDIDYACECLDPSESELIIADLDALQVSFQETAVCPGQEFTLEPTVWGGAVPYNFLWSTNTTASSLTTTANEPTNFTVTITDACGAITPASVPLAIQQVPLATLGGTTIDYCLGGDIVTLPVQLNGNPPWSLTYRINDQVQPTIFNINNSPFQLPVSQPGRYELEHFEDAICIGVVEGQGLVQPSGPEVEVALFPPTCPSANDGSIQVSITEGTPPFELSWNLPVEDAFEPSGLGVGLYQLSITDGAGCLNIQEVELSLPDRLDPDCEQFRLFVPNVFSPNDDGINDVFELHVGEDSFIELIESVQLYNRWGALIFEKKDCLPAERVPIWDGYFNTEKMNTRVFVWLIRLRLLDGRIETISGDLTLLK